MDKKILVEQAIQRFLATGGKLIRCSFGVKKQHIIDTDEYEWSPYASEQPACCGLSCYLLTTRTKHNSIGDSLDAAFGHAWAVFFMQGFDNGPIENAFSHKQINDDDRDAYSFGAEMWKKYGV